MRTYARGRALVYELTCAVVIFCFCMAVCAGVFMAAGRASAAGRNLSGAVFSAQIAAECFMYANGVDDLASALGGHVDGGAVYVHLDGSFQSTRREDGVFVMRVSVSERGGATFADILVSGGGIEYALTAAKLTQ